ncbi:MAG: flavodoxin family protein [Parachlamydiales bacterium]|jgi:multimeric flavodoxin WrbA
MKVCEKCKSTYDIGNRCISCGGKLSIPKKTDAYLKKFLEIDDKILKRFKEIQKATIKEAKLSSKPKTKIKVLGISGSARDEFDMAAENSNSEFLLIECLKELKKLGAETELIPLRKYDIKPCKACYSTTNTHCHFFCSCYPKGTPTGDDMSNILYQKVLDADILIFATPVNNFKISSYMALFIDRCISLDGSLPPADPKAVKNKELNIKHTKFIELTADEKVPGSGFLRRFIGKVAGIITTGHEEGTSMAISSLFMTLNHYGMIFPPWATMYAMSSVVYPTYKDKKFVTSSVFIEDAKKIAQNSMKAHKLIKKFNKFDWKYDYSSN